MKLKNVNLPVFLPLALAGIIFNGLGAVFSGNNLGFAYDDNVFWNYQLAPCWNKIYEDQKPYNFKTGANFEYAFNGHARDKDNFKGNLAQVFSKTESYLHSTADSTDPLVATSQLEKLLAPPFLITNSTGKILHYSLTIKKTANDINFWAALEGPVQQNGQFCLSAYLPLKFVNIYDFNAEMLPLPQSIQAVIDAVPAVKDELNNIEKLTKLNLAGLQLNTWENDKVWGDLHVMLSWNKTFAWMNQHETFVNIFAQGGLTFPTAEARDPQAAFAIARGNDNSIGLPLSIGVHADWQKMVRASFLADFLILKSESSLRRLRKNIAQTELLISDKVLAKKDPGMIYRATALLELSSQDKIYSGLIAWQFLYKKADKFVAFARPGYKQEVVNASERYQRQYFNNLIFAGKIDFKRLTSSPIAPKLTATYKMPITGKRVEMFHTLGITMSLSF